MKFVISSIVLMFVVGCAGIPFPSGQQQASAWEQFGQDQALEGQRKLSQRGLGGQVAGMTVAQYQAYSQGWEIGRIQYCDQDARNVGLRDFTYRGICDTIDPLFRSQYYEGRFERIN
ncbi:DUF2799 domain-containing protein [Vibrio sp. SM6]|uniref:DUF2799 domain-containing protein n=1 Tax=Vibrio agarilyticus TaxID=2726741 RepID=A0A7X8TP83_9VIBR|nr:DUF2799 domain-containing protein [Vibrio agarilyticus]NLS12417.1 DUF2799 domain-containing protein [Vibrio agarilyticus]